MAAWRVLGLDRTDDTTAIRRAYAARLRAMDVDADPAGFERLREARDVALRLARSADEPTDAFDNAAEGDDAPVPTAEIGGMVDVTLPPTVRVILGQPPVVSAIDRATLRAGGLPPAPAPTGTATVVVLPIEHDRAYFTAAREDIGLGDPALTVRHQVANEVVDAAFQTLSSVLQPDDDGSEDLPMSADEEATARAALSIVLSDPRLDEIGYRTSVDDWLADVIARSVPRSDPLIGPVAAVFDWSTRGRSVEATPAVAFLADRIDTIDFIGTVRQPDHVFHRAWRAVSAATPDDIRPKYLLSKRSVRKLLKVIREHHPGVEAYLDPTEVHRWEGTGLVAGPSRWIWIAMVIVFVRLLVSLSSSPSETPPPNTIEGPPPIVDTTGTAETPSLIAGTSDGLRDRRADLDMALLRITPGFDMARIRADNPDLASDLEGVWDAANRNGTRLGPFFSEIGTFLLDRFDVARRTADYADLREWLSLKRTVLQGVAQRGETMCDDFLRGDLDPSPFLTRDYFLARDALLAKVLLKAEPIATSQKNTGKRTFPIPADVVDTIVRRTDLPRETVTNALLHKATPRAQCQVTDAFYGAVLDLPRREGLPLLRQM